MDWQRNFVFDCLAGRAGLETPVSVADSETALMPAMTTHLLPVTKRPTGDARATPASIIQPFPLRLAYPRRSFIPTSLLYRRSAITRFWHGLGDRNPSHAFSVQS
jgi:hypothetical protein